MGTLKERFAKYGILGGLFTGVGGLGSFGVCHTICQAAIVVLAGVGITIIGMPFAFLAEPWFVILSFVVGGVFLVLALTIWLGHKKMTGIGVAHTAGKECCHAGKGGG